MTSSDGQEVNIELFDDYHLTLLKEGDAPEIVKAINDPRVNKWTRVVPVGPIYTTDDAFYLINKIASITVKGIDGGPVPVVYAIRSKEKFIGTIGLTLDSQIDTTGEFSDPVPDVSAPYCLIGYWLSPEYHQRGIMSRALDAILEEVAKKKLGLKVFVGHTFTGNIGSRRTLEKCGLKFQREIPNGSIKMYPREVKDLWEFIRIDE